MTSFESLQRQLQDDMEHRRQEVAAAMRRAQVTHREAEERTRTKEQEFSNRVLGVASFISDSMLDRRLAPTHSLSVWHHQLKHSLVLGNRSRVSNTHISDGWLLPDDSKKSNSKLLLGVGGLLIAYSAKYSTTTQVASHETGETISYVAADFEVPITNIQVPSDMPLQIDQPMIERSLVRFATEHDISLVGY